MARAPQPRPGTPHSDQTRSHDPKADAVTAFLQSETRATLLARLKATPDDPAAWADFVFRYGPRIHAWCKSWGLQLADAEDVTQDVLLKLSRKLCEFQYDPVRSFRAWLKTLTYRAWRDLDDDRDRFADGSGDATIQALLDQQEARRDLAASLEEAFDRELLDLAAVRVQFRVEPQTWEAYRLLAIEGWSGADAATSLGMKVATVYVARGKVQRMLRDEVARLEGDRDPA